MALWVNYINLSKYANQAVKILNVKNITNCDYYRFTERQK